MVADAKIIHGQVVMSNELRTRAAALRAAAEVEPDAFWGADPALIRLMLLTADEMDAEANADTVYNVATLPL